MKGIKVGVAVLNGSTGFKEIADALLCAMEECGIEAVRMGKYDFLRGDVQRKIIIAANLGRTLSQWYPGKDWRELVNENDIIYSTEQMRDSVLDHGGLWEIYREREVWDYSANNVLFLREKGFPRVKLVPLTYVKGLARIPRVEQDVDVMFYGSMNDRRRRIIDGLLATGLTCEIYDQNRRIWGEQRDEIIARSKVIVNIHFYEYKIFESARVFYLVTNGKCVVSESGSDEIERLYRGAVVMADYDSMVDVVRRYVEDDDLRRRQEITALDEFRKLPLAPLVRWALMG